MLLVTLVNRPAFGVFLGDNPEAIDIASHIHHRVSWSFVLSSVVRATGAVIPPLVILIISLWIFRIPFACALMPVLGANSLWWSFPVGSGMSMLMSIAYYRFGNWRSARML